MKPRERQQEIIALLRAMQRELTVDEVGRCQVRFPEVARLTQLMLKRANRRFLLADHTKAGAHSYVTYGSLNDFDLWITTPGINTKRLAAYKKMTTIKEVNEMSQTEKEP